MGIQVDTGIKDGNGTGKSSQPSEFFCKKKL
jgi:hypothetical protein